MWPFKRTEPAPERSVDQQKVILCPRCRIGMNKIVRNEVVIDFCARCHGMWLDHGELTKLIDIHEQHLTKEIKSVADEAKSTVQKSKHIKKKASSKKKRK